MSVHPVIKDRKSAINRIISCTELYQYSDLDGLSDDRLIERYEQFVNGKKPEPAPNQGDLRFFVIGPGYWGVGFSLQAAIDNAVKQRRSRKRETVQVRICIPAERINDMHNRVFKFNSCPLKWFDEPHDGEADSIPIGYCDAWVNGSGNLNWVRCHHLNLGTIEA